MISIVGQTVVDKYVTYTYVGKSTDTKPTAPNGSKFEEMDTGDEYFFDGDEYGWTKKADKYLVSIEVTTAPTKTAYFEGDEFDPTGMVVTATYTDNSTSPVTDYDVIVPSTLTADVESIEIEYVENGRTRKATQEITVTPVALSSIAFSTNPTKTSYYEGETLDLTGAVVTATYNNSDTKDVTESCTFAPEDGATLATTDTAVVATYVENGVEKTANVAITVTAIALSSIAFTTNPTKVIYIEGEDLDLAGTVITATYNNGDTKDVTADCTFSPEDGTELTNQGSVTITATYTENEVEKTATTSVTVGENVA